MGDFNFDPYIGIDIGYMKVDYPDETNPYSDYIPDSFKVFDLSVGARLHRHLGFELGFFKTLEEEKGYQARILGTDITGKVGTQYYGYYADLIGYVPIGNSDGEDTGFEFLGSLGIGRIHAKAKVEAGPDLPIFGTSSKAKDSMVRYSLGGQYTVSEQFTVKMVLHYLSFDLDKQAKDGQIIDLGLRYSF